MGLGDVTKLPWANARPRKQSNRDLRHWLLTGEYMKWMDEEDRKRLRMRKLPRAYYTDLYNELLTPAATSAEITPAATEADVRANVRAYYNDTCYQ